MIRPTTPVEDRLDATIRVWLMLYPQSWQDRHGDEAQAILVDRAMERGGRISPVDVVDLIWHAFAARLDSVADPVLTRLPTARRAIFALVALMIATTTSLIMITGEAYGAAHRPGTLPADVPANATFLSGPFLTIGAGLDVGFIVAFALFVAGLTRGARIAVLATTIFAIWVSLPEGLAGYPHPPQLYSAAMAVLGLMVLVSLADGTRVRPRWRARIGGLVGVLSAAGVGLISAVTGEPGWSPLQPAGSVVVTMILYAVSLVVLVVAIGAALIPAIRHRQFGGVLMVMIAATLATGLHAVAATLGSEPLTVWIWPVLGVAGTVLIFDRLRRIAGRNTNAVRNPPASGPTTITP